MSCWRSCPHYWAKTSACCTPLRRSVRDAPVAVVGQNPISTRPVRSHEAVEAGQVKHPEAKVKSAGHIDYAAYAQRADMRSQPR